MVVRCSNPAPFVVLETAPTVRTGIRVEIYDGADPATLLDVLPDTFSRKWVDELNATGSGSFSVFERNPKLEANPDLLAYGNVARFILDGVARFAITIEKKRKTQLRVGDDLARVLTVEGRGVLAKLEEAVIYPAGGVGPNSAERLFDGVAGDMLETLLTEAQARGALVGITWNFAGPDDSNNASWAVPIELTERATTDLLRVAERIAEVAADVRMTPDLELFVANTIGVDRSVQTVNAGPVVFRGGHNVVELERDEDGAIRNALLIETPAGFLERVEGASLTTYRRREAGLSLGNVTASDQVDRSAEAVFRRSADPAAHISIEVLDVGDRHRPFVNWNVGDWVLAPNADDELERYRVRALTVSETADGRPRFIPELSTITAEFEQRTARWLQAMARGTLGGTAAGIAEPNKASTEVVNAVDGAIEDHVNETPHVDELADLADVDLTGLSAGDFLTYDPPNWIAVALELADLADVDATTPADGDVLTWDGDSWTPSPIPSLAPFTLGGVLTVAAGTHRFRFPIAAEILSIAATVATAPTGASVIVDVNRNGVTVFTTQANRPTIAAGANASSDAVPDVTSIAAGQYLTVDVDQIGSTVAGADLVVVVLWRPT